MASFSSAALMVLEIYSFKVKKMAFFLEKFSPYEISKSEDKISDFSVFKIGF